MRVIDDFLPADLYTRLKAVIAAAPFRYGAKSNSKTDPHGHWSWKPLHDDRHNLADIAPLLGNDWTTPLLATWAQVKERLATSGYPALIRCYVNAYTYGTDGYFHSDSQRQDEQTAILYICDQWQPDWAGETVVLQGSDVAGACLPRPNRLLLIASDSSHAARAVSRMCPELRTVLVFKLRPRRSNEFEQLSQWLVQHGALSINHHKGTLHDHLVRTYQSLAGRTMAATALGGGLHSIYGTSALQRQLISPTPDGRAGVARAFGQQVENLAYMFSILDRPRTLDFAAQWAAGYGNNAVPQINLELSYQQRLQVDRETAHALCLIECANLVDQDALSRWPNLARLWTDTPACGKGGPTPQDVGPTNAPRPLPPA